MRAAVLDARSQPIVNLAQRPKGSDWAAGAGAGGTRLVQYPADARFPSGICTQETWTTAPTSLSGLYIGAVVTNVTPGVRHWISVHVASSSFDVSPALSGMGGKGDLSARVDTYVGNDVTRYAWALTPAAGVSSINFVLVPNALPTVDSVWRAGALMVDASPDLHIYADGDTPGWRWEGTPGASTSIGYPRLS